MSTDGIRLALSWLTVLPVRAGTVDARSCRHAIGLAPLVGAGIGAFGAAMLWALTSVGAAPLLAGLLTAATLVLITRGMHVDGLADTVDGLGCYGPPERALRIMRDGSTGPFAVVALIVVLAAQTISLAALAVAREWPAVVLACATGRAAFVLCCRRGLGSARSDGLGALVAGSQSVRMIIAWWFGLLAVSAFAADPWWLGPIAIGVTVAVLLAFGQHVRSRFNGITGDVLGAASEIATTLALVVCSLR